MGFVTSALGLGGGNAKQAPITSPATAGQALDQYGNVVSGLNQQQQFVNALGGLGGVGNLNAAYQNYSNLANGVGPNPAMDQLNETTRANIAQQAGLQASQRGAGANPALIAREAAMQGANTQQQAAGQAATLSAQQQLAGIQGQANIANQEVGYQGQGLGNYNQYAQNAQQNVLNSIAGVNSAHVTSQGSVNTANSSSNSNIGGPLLSGILNGAGKGAAMFAARGGQVPIRHYDDGGSVGPMSAVGRFFKGITSNAPSNTNNSSPINFTVPGDENSTAQQVMQGSSDFVSGVAKGIKGIASDKGPGSVAGDAPALDVAAKGSLVPGKARVRGDSYSNDTVPAMLSPGEVVVPRHVMQSKDPVSGAAKFVAAILAKKGGMKRRTA